MFSMFLFIMILVPQLVLSGASANHYVKSLGVDRVKDEAILADYGYTSTQVSVNLAYGDKSDFRSPQVVNVLWDENAVVVALLVYHKMGIIDDKGNIVEAFVDARAGGVGVKTQDKCYLGPEVCYKYE
ncbi:MAG: hypothetical protein LRS43_00345, partial [Desulfurococcales archaeon]|nr:hypothetical protein [Desulfurococcales archaeon]